MKESWNFPFVSISIVLLWQVYVFSLKVIQKWRKQQPGTAFNWSEYEEVNLLQTFTSQQYKHNYDGFGGRRG